MLRRLVRRALFLLGIAIVFYNIVPDSTSYLGQIQKANAQGGTGLVNVALSGSDFAGCGSAGSPCKTIRFAVGQAVNGDEVRVAAGTYQERIDINGKQLRIIGAGQGTTIIDAQSTSGSALFYVSAPAGSELQGFTIRNGSSDVGGGIRLFQSTVQLSDLTVQNNTASGVGGGGIWLDRSSAQINDIIVENNQATRDPDGSGGGIYLLDSSATMSNVIARNNTAFELGGGIILVRSSNVSMTQMTIEDNVAGQVLSTLSVVGDAGGGIYMFESSPSLSDSTIARNFAGKQGGGIYLSMNSNATLQNVTLRDNEARGEQVGGGGIYIFQSSATIVDSLIEDNTVEDGGAGVWIEESPLTVIRDSIIQNNAVEGTNSVGFNPGAGGIYAFLSAIQIVDTQILSNTVVTAKTGNFDGGGGLFLQGTTGTLRNVTVAGNVSDRRGGGFVIKDTSTNIVSNINIDNSVVSNNQAQDGGGLFVTDSIATIQNSAISNNTATRNGGSLGILYSGRSNVVVTVEDSQLENNQANGSAASDGGGAVYMNGANTLLNLRRSKIMNNTTPSGYGGALHLRNKAAVNLTNNFLGFNNAGQQGGGIYNISETASTFIHNTIARNTSASGGGGLHCQLGTHTLANLILWNNTPSNFLGGGGSTCTPASVTGLFESDPQFVDENGGDFHLTSGSTAINAGANQGVSKDVDDQLRDNSPDIGADEALPDVEIVKSGTKVGNSVTYTLVFTNKGSVLATSVAIADTVPGVLSGVSYTSSGATLTENSGPPAYQWDVEDLAFQEGGIITITGTYAGENSFSNTATIQADSEVDTSNNSSTKVLPVRFIYLPIVLRN